MGRGLNVGRRRKWFRARREATAAGGTYDEVEYTPTLDREFLQITRISVEDEDSDPSGKLRIYVAGHGYPHWIGEEASPGEATLYWVRWPTFLVTGESVVARFYGATADDILSMYLEGWIWDYPPVPGAPLEAPLEGIE